MTDKDVIYRSYPPADMTAAEFEHFVVEMLQQTESEVDSLDIRPHEVVDGADGSYDFDATVRYRLLGMDFPPPPPPSREVALEMGAPVFVGHCYANGSESNSTGVTVVSDYPGYAARLLLGTEAAT